MTKKFKITNNSLKVEIKRPLSYIEDEFPFEEVTKKHTRKKSPNLFTLIPGLVCFIGVIITTYSHFYEEKGSLMSDILFYAIPSASLLIISVFISEDVIYLFLINGRTLSFYANSPNKTEVNTFIEQLLSDQKKYLLNRYAKADPYLSPEQLSTNLKWLRDRNVIDDTELADFQIKILPKPGGSSSVGFKISPTS